MPADGVAVVDFKTEGGDAGATGIVRGVVTVGGQPQAGASVFATDDRGMDAGVSAETDAEGRYEVRGLKAGRVRLQVQTSDGNSTVKSVTLDKPGAELTLRHHVRRRLRGAACSSAATARRRSRARGSRPSSTRTARPPRATRAGAG